jgi:hypothetical protein
MYVAGDTLASEITFFHTAQYPSTLQLPGTGLVLTNPAVEMANVNLFPNPASTHLTIPVLNPGDKVSILDLLGRNCGAYFLNDARQIQPEHLPSGTYWIQTDSGPLFFQWHP